MLSLLTIAQATGLRGISDGDGLAISVTGMLIVFAALAGITIFIAWLPRVLAVLDPWLPELEDRHGVSGASETNGDDEAIAAAAFAYHCHASREGEG